MADAAGIVAMGRVGVGVLGRLDAPVGRLLQPTEDFLTRHDVTWLAGTLTVVLLMLLITPLALTTALFIGAVVAS